MIDGKMLRQTWNGQAQIVWFAFKQKLSSSYENMVFKIYLSTQNMPKTVLSVKWYNQIFPQETFP